MATRTFVTPTGQRTNAVGFEPGDLLLPEPTAGASLTVANAGTSRIRVIDGEGESHPISPDETATFIAIGKRWVYG